MIKSKILIKEGWLDWDKRLGNMYLNNNQVEDLVYEYTNKGIDNKYLKRRAAKMDFEEIKTRRYFQNKHKYKHVFIRGIRIRILTNVSVPKMGKLPEKFDKTIIIIESVSSSLLLDALNGKEFERDKYNSIMMSENTEIIEIFGGSNLKQIVLDEIEEVVLYDGFVYIEDKHSNKMVCLLEDKTIEYNNSLSNIKYNKEGIELFKKNKIINIVSPFIKFKLLKYNL